MKTVEALLRERIGLDSSTIGSSVVSRTVRLRMKAASAARAEDYVKVLESSEAEWRSLIEAVVVAESWFFRDREAFNALTHFIYSEWMAANPVESLRILSLPCSTGEEPYSIAMALEDARFPAQRVVIDAVDISERSLARARQAVYGRNSFRGGDLAFRERHFAKLQEGWQVLPHLACRVTFRQANLLEDDLSKANAAYHFIFCRNLLIYFDRPTQARALTQLKQLLAPGGHLFVGPAEIPLVVQQGFVPVNFALAFASRLADPRKAKHAAKPPSSRHRTASAPVPLKTPGHSVPAEPKRSQPKPGPSKPVAAPNAAPDLDSARRLADAGKLAEARQACELYLKEVGPSADAFYLLGLIYDAAGEPQAVGCYRRAIYLKPDHQESLLQLALLLEKMGDRNGARAARRRAERAQQKEKAA